MNARMIILAAAAAASVASQSAMAACAEYYHPAYHLVVCRPFDSWSGDEKVMDGERDVVERHLGRVAWKDASAKDYVRGAALSVFNSPSDDPLTQDTMALLKTRGIDVAYRGHYSWVLGVGVDITAENYAMLREGQSLLYDDLIRRQGDPDKLPSSFASRRLVGNILGLASIGVGYQKFGGTGGTVAATTVAGDVSQLPRLARQTFAPFDLPKLELPPDAALQVYPVTVQEGGSRGQVIVAFKVARTDELQRSALVEAMASLAGSDTTPAAIDAARAADLAHRKEIWGACIAAEQCGPKAHAAEESK